MATVLSIGIPTHNRCNYLMELMPTLLQQCQEADASYTKIEIIISDNASTDMTPEYVLKNFGDSRRVKYYRNAVNIGADANFVNLVERANGRYVWLVGDDELLKDDAVGNVLDIIEKYSCSLLILKDEEYNTGLGESRLFKSYGDLVSVMSRRNPHFLLAHTLITLNVFKKEIFDVQRASRFAATNYGHMYAISEKLKGGGTVYVLSKPFIRVRKHRAPLAQQLRALLLKQARYINYVGMTYGSNSIKMYSYKFFLTRLLRQVFWAVVLKIYKIGPVKKAYKRLVAKRPS